MSSEAIPYRSVLLQRSGAVEGEGVDAGVAWHYGDPLREQRALTEAAAFVDRSHRQILTISGSDRLSWLNDLSTQSVVGLGDGDTTQTLVLSPQGHIEHHANITERSETVWLDVESGSGPSLLAFLDSMRFMLRVEPADRSADWALLALVGPTAPTVLETVTGIATPEPGRAAPLAGGGWARRVATDAGLPHQFDLLVHRAELADWARRLDEGGATAAGTGAFEAVRIAARRPRHGFETDHKTIPNELSWLRTAVHLTKGCYRGQETVARVANLGRPPRRIELVHLDGVSEIPPALGSQIAWEGKTVGALTSVSRHYELGLIALASLKRSVTSEAQLDIGGQMASIDPDPDAPDPDAVPAGRIARDRLAGRG